MSSIAKRFANAEGRLIYKLVIRGLLEAIAIGLVYVVQVPSCAELAVTLTDRHRVCLRSQKLSSNHTVVESGC